MAHFTGYGIDSDSEEDPSDDQDRVLGQVVNFSLCTNSILYHVNLCLTVHRAIAACSSVQSSIVCKLFFLCVSPSVHVSVCMFVNKISQKLLN